MITVSCDAANELKKLLLEDNKPYVRVSVKGGGCSGLMYDLSFDTVLQETDTLCEDREVKILIDKNLYFI